MVLPLYNEAGRLDLRELARLVRSPLRLVLVDDGSTDGTPALLRRFVAEQDDPPRLLVQERNTGKGEAVRRGLLAALSGGAAVVGFADADLATPVDEIVRMAAVSETATADLVLGARIKMAGRHVERRAVRHYLGRVIATYIDTRTRLGVYDTQCGLKFLRDSPELRAALAEPFATRWLFDVELLRRLRTEHAASGRPLAMREEPLETWVDTPGTRLRGSELTRVARDFARLEQVIRAEHAARSGRSLASGPGTGPAASHAPPFGGPA